MRGFLVGVLVFVAALIFLGVDVGQVFSTIGQVVGTAIGSITDFFAGFGKGATGLG